VLNDGPLLIVEAFQEGLLGFLSGEGYRGGTGGNDVAK
jgi:hypothetical protein